MYVDAMFTSDNTGCFSTSGSWSHKTAEARCPDRHQLIFRKLLVLFRSYCAGKVAVKIGRLIFLTKVFRARLMCGSAGQGLYGLFTLNEPTNCVQEFNFTRHHTMSKHLFLPLAGCCTGTIESINILVKCYIDTVLYERTTQTSHSTS